MAVLGALSRGIRPLVASAFVASASVVAWLGAGGSAAAAEKPMSWDDEVCSNTIRFDPAKYDETRLRNTVSLLFSPSELQPPIAVAPMEPKSIATLDLAGSDRECSKVLERARSMTLLPLKGIEDYRDAKVAEIKDWCDFESVKIRGFGDPAALREYQPAAAACSRFIDALEGRTDIIATFRDMARQVCSRNASPASCNAGFISQSQRPDGKDWVRLQVTSFGWNNCATEFTVANAGRKKRDQMRTQLEGQFKRLFKIKQDNCDSP